MGEQMEPVKVYGSLVIFGIMYNLFVTWLERRHHDRGYTAFLVVVGVAVTLLGAGFLIGFEQVAVVFVCFAASGAAMVLGSVWRYVKFREREEAAREEEEQKLKASARKFIER